MNEYVLVVKHVLFSIGTSFILNVKLQASLTYLGDPNLGYVLLTQL